MSKTVQLKPQRVESLNYKQSGAKSEFWFDGQAYILTGNQTKSVRNDVADAWVAHDSNVRIVQENY